MSPESPLDATHSPEHTGPVWRDRGTIIANQQARIAELELSCQRLRDDYQGALAERDEARAALVRVRALGDAFADDGAARYGGNIAWHIEEAIANEKGDFPAAADQRIASQRDRAEAAEADAAGLRARMLRLADARDVKYPAKFAFGAAENHVAGYRAAQADFRAALAAEPTPAAEPVAFCVCDHDQRHHLNGSGPCSRDIHETGAPCDCRRFAESALSREVNQPTPAAEPHAEDGA